MKDWIEGILARGGWFMPAGGALVGLIFAVLTFAESNRPQRDLVLFAAGGALLGAVSGGLLFLLERRRRG